MTFETDIVEALRASHVTHRAILDEIARLKRETAALKAKLDAIEKQAATLEAAAVDIVEPSVTQPVIDELMRHVEALRAAVRPGSNATVGPAAQAAVLDTVRTAGVPFSTPDEALSPDASRTAETPLRPGPRSSARPWSGLGPAADLASAPVPETRISSRPSRFGFRSG